MTNFNKARWTIALILLVIFTAAVFGIYEVFFALPGTPGVS